MPSSMKVKKQPKATAQASRSLSEIYGYNPDLYPTNGGYNPEYWQANGLATSAWYPPRTTPNIREAGGQPFPLRKKKRHQHDLRERHERVPTANLSGETAPAQPSSSSTPPTAPSAAHHRYPLRSATLATSSSTSMPPPTAPASTKPRKGAAQPKLPTESSLPMPNIFRHRLTRSGEY